MSKYMYRAQILEKPEFEAYYAFDDRSRHDYDVEEWYRPVGWVADADYIGRFGTDKYFEPDTDKWFKSRSSAAARVKLLEGMGYVAIVQRSAPVVWPARGQKAVPAGLDVASAARVVEQAGFKVAY